MGKMSRNSLDTEKIRPYHIFWMSYVLLLVGAVILGSLTGLVFGYAVDLPRVEELESQTPNLVSVVYSEDNRILGQFALEKRVLVTFEQIPDHLKWAIVAAEDANFFKHAGIDFRRLLATVFYNIVRGEMKGASTLTMQLSKMRFTSIEKTLERKIKDFLYAIDIEKNYSKEQIFTFYANQVPLGHGVYGVAAAADFYFKKPLDELTIAEAATIAGIIQTPGRQSPILHPDRALQRRNYVLAQMLENGFITDQEYSSARQEELSVVESQDPRSPAPYFVEWVRQYLERAYDQSLIWEQGLRIYTTVDYDMQVAAERALRNGLKDFDQTRNRWQGPLENILEQGQNLDEYTHSDWRQLFFEGLLVHGLVLESTPESAMVRIGTYTATVGPEAIAWTKREDVSQILKSGDVALFRLDQINRSEKVVTVTLEQIPEVQGALLALDNRSGAIKAMVGGYDFERSKFNRATQALRQPGSVFKPFTYVAALEAGFTPSDQVLDSPVTFYDALGRPYSPSNSDGEYKGLITVREGLALSRNIPTVRLANALGPEKIVDVAQRFGIDRPFPAYLSIALGSVEVTLQEMVSAFSVFPNQGVRAEPYFIKRVEDHTRTILEEHKPSLRDEVISPAVAAQMISMLRDVVHRGTATFARTLNRPVAGKTGTTNDYTDSWFIGFDPHITVGVWCGHDTKKSLGNKVYGATLALPIWVDFMQTALETLPEGSFPNEPQWVTRNQEFQAIPDVAVEMDQPTESESQPIQKGIRVEDIRQPAPDPAPPESPVPPPGRF